MDARKADSQPRYAGPLCVPEAALQEGRGLPLDSRLHCPQNGVRLCIGDSFDEIDFSNSAAAELLEERSAEDEEKQGRFAPILAMIAAGPGTHVGPFVQRWSAEGLTVDAARG